MWAEKVLAFRAAMPHARQVLASPVLRQLRMRKSAAEVQALRSAGEAIDRVHAQMAQWLRVGRTERAVGRDIADAIIAEGHTRVDFVIVGSGPNGASPHAEVSDRVLEAGDTFVVDIGATTETGYCSDETHTYSLGKPPFGGQQLLCRAAACTAGRLPARASGGDRGVGRLRGPQHHRRSGIRPRLPSPHRPRHRAGDPRRAPHRGWQHHCAGARDDILHRAGHLPARPTWRPDRGHRGDYRRRLRAAQRAAAGHWRALDLTPFRTLGAPDLPGAYSEAVAQTAVMSAPEGPRRPRWSTRDRHQDSRWPRSRPVPGAHS